MSGIACPRCQLQMAWIGELAGRHVACPQCQATFVMPVRDAPQLLPPSPPPTTPIQSTHTSTASLPSSIVRRRNGPSPATSIFDFFDWKFEKFVTPWVIRITWVLFLIQSALWLILLAYTGLTNTFASTPQTQRSSSSQFAEALEQWSSERRGSRPPRETGLSKVILWSVAAIWTAIVTLWVRVMLEFGMVIFTGARTLADIRELLSNRES